MSGVLADRRWVVVGAGLLALAAVAATRLVTVLHNVPFDPLAVSSPVMAGTAVGTPFVLGLALVAAGLASDRATARVGLLFAGVFGSLAVLGPAATLPAVVALVAGGGLALLGTIGVPDTYRAFRRAVLAVLFLAAIAVSVGSSVGLLDANLRGLGGVLALGALAAATVRIEDDRLALLAGGVATLAVVAASTTSPYVLGSAMLVGFAVVGVPHLLAALAVGAGVAVAVAGLRRGAHALAAGGGLLVFAGVPATVPRAMAVLLGATLVVLDVGPDGLAPPEVRA